MAETNVIIIFKYANIIFTIFENIKFITMKIKLLKDHLGNKKDDVIEVTDKRGEYLIRTNVGVLNKKASVKTVPISKFKTVIRD